MCGVKHCYYLNNQHFKYEVRQVNYEVRTECQVCRHNGLSSKVIVAFSQVIILRGGLGGGEREREMGRGGLGGGERGLGKWGEDEGG